MHYTQPPITTCIDILKKITTCIDSKLIFIFSVKLRIRKAAHPSLFLCTSVEIIISLPCILCMSSSFLPCLLLSFLFLLCHENSIHFFPYFSHTPASYFLPSFLSMHAVILFPSILSMHAVLFPSFVYLFLR